MFRESTLTLDTRSRDELIRHNRALIAEVKLLKKCLDEASADRDCYKRQIDLMNEAYDRYIRQEKDIERLKKDWTMEGL